MRKVLEQLGTSYQEQHESTFDYRHLWSRDGEKPRAVAAGTDEALAAARRLLGDAPPVARRLRLVRRAG